MNGNSDHSCRVVDDDSLRISAIVIYVLFLAGWPTLHLTTIAGVILAYVQRDAARGTLWESHIEAIISTFWTGIVVGVAGILACITIVGLVVGIPLLVGLSVWLLYRTIRGLIHAIDNRVF